MFVSAADMETFGMAVHEARAFGLPVLALDAGHVRAHLTSPDHGSLFGSLDELTEACIALIRDPDECGRVAARAHAARLADDYSWDAAAERLLAGLAPLLDF